MMIRNMTFDRAGRRAKRLAVALLGFAMVAAAGAALAAPPQAKAVEVMVYKSPSCGCCGGWVAYLRRHGFRVTIKDTEDMDPVKRMFGVPDNLAACHTAIVAGYIVEGHVPVASIHKLLAERPKARGISVPGMPPGTPGMGGEGSGPVGVLLFDKDGSARRYDID